MRLIDADAFIKEARNRIDMQDLYLPVHIKEMVLDEMPTVEAEPVRHGKWIFTGRKNVYGGIEVKCSQCENSLMIQHIEQEKYCCFCGARMDGEIDE